MQEFGDRFIQPELMVLIPVLYLIGMFLKSSRWVDDRSIPLYLGAVGVILSAAVIFSTRAQNGMNWTQAIFASLTQGILVAGMAVYTNQIVKQSTKES